MKTKILSNKKLFMIIGAAVALFVTVNIAWWINANASQADNSAYVQSVNGKTVYKGRHIEGGGGDKYEFVQGVNMPDFYLDADHNPNFPTGDWFGMTCHKDRSISWDNSKDHPWVQAEFWYGGNGDVGNSEYRFWNLRFIESHWLDGLFDRGTGYLGIHYGKEAPDSLLTKQGMEIFFKLDCYDGNGNYIETKRTHDGFRDKFDDDWNSEVLERAGADKKRGDTFREALDLVGYNTLYYALKDGRIKISIERIVMEQDDYS